MMKSRWIAPFSFLLFANGLNVASVRAADGADPTATRSKVISQIAYDPAASQLTVTLKDGTSRVHHGVPAEIAQRFRESQQPGGFYRANIDRIFRTEASLTRAGITFEPVNSTIFDGSHYDASTRVLTLLGDDGVLTRYADVPEAVHTAFLQAPFKGAFFQANIRERYPTSVVEVAPPPEEEAKPAEGDKAEDKPTDEAKAADPAAPAESAPAESK